MEKTPSRYRRGQDDNIKMTVKGVGMDLSSSGQTLVKMAGPTKAWKI